MPIGLNKDSGGAKQAPKQKTKAETVNNDEVIEDIEDFTMKQSRTVDKKIFILGAAAAVVIIAIIIATVSSKKSSTTNGTEVSNEQSQTEQTVPQSPDDGVSDVGDNTDNQENNYSVNNGGTSADNTIKPGITNYDDEMDVMTTGATVYDANDFISDLNGLEVPAIYNVEKIEYVTDYVNYETRRASIDNGMEIYWIEAKYHEKKYRVQIPYCYYKNMQDSGICKVNMEVLNLVGGGQLVSYMQVIPEED